MEPLLILVTVVSLVLGCSMSVVAWRLLRDDRTRAAARIEALQARANEVEADPADGFPDEVDGAPEPGFLAPREPATAVASARFQWLEEVDDTPTVVDEPAWDQTFRRESEARPVATVSPGMFSTAEEPAVPTRRWLALATVVGVVALGAGLVYAARTFDIAGAIGRATPVLSAKTAVPLELLSLRHSTDEAGTFTVTGLVQNPPTGRELRGVVAVVYLFDQQGRYFASGKVPLEAATFHPGADVPFVVTIPNAGGLSRYRIGFRLEDGAVASHIDRRGQLPGGTTEDTLESGADRAIISTPLAGPRRSEG